MRELFGALELLQVQQGSRMRRPHSSLCHCEGLLAAPHAGRADRLAAIYFTSPHWSGSGAFSYPGGRRWNVT